MPSKAYVEGVQNQVSPVSLTDIQNLVNTMQSIVNNMSSQVTTINTVVSGISSSSYAPVEFPSLTQHLVQIDIGPADIALPDVVIDAISGTVQRAIAIVKFHNVHNDSANPNWIDGDQYIQIRRVGGAWTNCITLVNGQYELLGDADGGGDIVVGEIDVHAIAGIAGTYNFQIAQGAAQNNSLMIYEFQIVLRLWIKPS